MKIKLNWKRLIWCIFIVSYAALFFYNCLSPFRNWFLPYIYTMLLILWMAREYYEKKMFFQSGLLPSEMQNMLLRAIFALFFYSSFIIGIITVVAWHTYQIKAYPVFSIIGVLLFAYALYMRERVSRTNGSPSADSIANFYISVTILMISLNLGYGSYFLILYTLVIGVPLIILQERHEEKIFSRFMDYTHGGQKNLSELSPQQYEALWEKYLEKILPGRRK